MANDPALELLLAQVKTLTDEVGRLRIEVAELKRAQAGKALPGPAQAPVPLAPPVPPLEKQPDKGITWCPQCHARNDLDAVYCDNCSAEMRPQPKPKPAGPLGLLKKKEEKPPARPEAPPPAAPWSLSEKFIGEKLLQYAGMVILALGIVFFLIWTAAHAGPEARVAIALAAGAALIYCGREAERRPPYDKLAGTLIGGGWTIVYVTFYAAYHWAPTKVLSSPELEIGLLLCTAAGMVAHALARRSRPLRLYAVALTYFVMLFCGQEIGSFDLFLILFAASAWVAAYSGEADVLLASLAGYYANFLPVYFRTIAAAPAERTMANFLPSFAWIALAYLVVAALPLIPKARQRLFADKPEGLGEAALCANSLLFAGFAGSMGRVYFGVPHLERAVMLCVFFALPSLVNARLLSKSSASAGLNAVIGLGLLAAAIFEMPDPMWKLLAWISVSVGWTCVGLLLEQPYWRASGLVMALATFAFWANVAMQGPEPRREASMALFLFAGVSYFFSRYLRVWLAEPEAWEPQASELWLHSGTAALILALWGVLDAAPFLCALVGLAVIGEHAALGLDRVGLWVQAACLEVALGVYSFFVDYGAETPVAGASPRALASGLVVAGYAYLYFADPMSEELAGRHKGFKRADQRRWLSWLMTAVAVFAACKELDGRLRLPFFALGLVGLYWLGRTRAETHFKNQSILLSVGAAFEAVTTYLMAPPALLSPIDAYKTVFYWGACAALAGGLVLAKDEHWGEPSGLDEQAATLFGLLSLGLGACYLYKELAAVQLTLAWTVLGIVYLGAGLALGWRELRYPALGLLGICVLKALFSDTANLPLPHRVASFVALGVVLIFASSLYVRANAGDEKDPPAGPR